MCCGFCVCGVDCGLTMDCVRLCWCVVCVVYGCVSVFYVCDVSGHRVLCLSAAGCVVGLTVCVACHCGVGCVVWCLRVCWCSLVCVVCVRMLVVGCVCVVCVGCVVCHEFGVGSLWVVCMVTFWWKCVGAVVGGGGCSDGVRFVLDLCGHWLLFVVVVCIVLVLWWVRDGG